MGDDTQNPEYTKLLVKGSKVFNPDGSPFEFEDRPYVYAINASGGISKCYRSYSDYCD